MRPVYFTLNLVASAASWVSPSSRRAANHASSVNRTARWVASLWRAEDWRKRNRSSLLLLIVAMLGTLAALYLVPDFQQP